jgi:hypothetical protein
MHSLDICIHMLQPSHIENAKMIVLNCTWPIITSRHCIVCQFYTCWSLCTPYISTCFMFCTPKNWSISPWTMMLFICFIFNMHPFYNIVILASSFTNHMHQLFNSVCLQNVLHQNVDTSIRITTSVSKKLYVNVASLYKFFIIRCF